MINTVLAADRRLVMLRSLSEATDYRLNESTLRQVLGHFGHQVSREIVRSDLQFLGEHGLLRTETLHGASGELQIATLTDDGLAVANGRKHPGVARRPPGG